MTNPYQTSSSVEEIAFTEPEQPSGSFGYLSRLPTRSLAYASWLVWGLFIAYRPRYSGADSLGVFVFGATIGVFSGKLFNGPAFVKVFVALACSVLPVMLIVSLSLLSKPRPVSIVGVLVELLAFTLGCLFALVVAAKLFDLATIATERIRVQPERAAAGFEAGAAPATMLAVPRRLALVFLPLAAFQILESALLSVRVYWFHDFLFIDPWLWFTAPIAWALTIWALRPAWRNRSRWVGMAAIAIAAVIAACFLMLAIPIGNSAIAVLHLESKPEERWLACNFLLAFAWFYRGVVDDFRD